MKDSLSLEKPIHLMPSILSFRFYKERAIFLLSMCKQYEDVSTQCTLNVSPTMHFFQNCPGRYAEMVLPDVISRRRHSSEKLTSVICNGYYARDPPFKDAWDLSPKSCRHPTSEWMPSHISHFHQTFLSQLFLINLQSALAGLRPVSVFMKWLYTFPAVILYIFSLRVCP